MSKDKCIVLVTLSSFLLIFGIFYVGVSDSAHSQNTSKDYYRNIETIYPDPVEVNKCVVDFCNEKLNLFGRLELTRTANGIAWACNCGK